MGTLCIKGSARRFGQSFDHLIYEQLDGELKQHALGLFADTGRVEIENHLRQGCADRRAGIQRAMPPR